MRMMYIMEKIVELWSEIRSSIEWIEFGTKYNKLTRKT